MNDKEKKAIKEIERELTDEDRKEYMSKWFALDLKILLNLIQKQKEEIEKKDKIIDKMTRRMLIYQIKDSKLIEKICNECGYEDCCEYISQDCIKQYFERKVENGN